jgi:transcriptional regulator with XRE-family HTH domain
MNRTDKKIANHHQKRLDYISAMLREIRFSEGKNQSDFAEDGVSRRQIQRVESGCNISLVRLFAVLDCYNYTLSDFFEDMP